MAKNGRVVLLIVAIGVLIAVLLLYRGQSSSGPVATKLEVSATALENDATHCRVTVRVDRPANDVELLVTLSAPEGIQFTNNNQKISKIVGDMNPKGVRIKDFECSFADEPLHSGAYVVKIVVTHLKEDGSTGDEYADGKTKLFVELQADNTNIFLQDEPTFDAKFTEPYVKGVYYSYWLEMQPKEEKPTTGLLHLKIDSQKDGFAPILNVGIKGGVRFLSPAFTGFIQQVSNESVGIYAEEIDSGGSRIVTIPISMLPAADPGSYGIKVIQVGQGEKPGEMAPLYIGVRTSPEEPGQKWLEPDKRDDAPMLTPAPHPTSHS